MAVAEENHPMKRTVSPYKNESNGKSSSDRHI
jgi:hypothetical protein